MIHYLNNSLFSTTCYFNIILQVQTTNFLSQEGDEILDPFLGSGQIARGALWRSSMFNLLRDEITFEVIEDFCMRWQEGVRVEYKSIIHNEIPKTLSSFANTQGGVLIIGVETDKTHNKVIFPIRGIQKENSIEERFVQSGLMGINPPVIPEVIILDVPGTENIVIVVRVDESVQGPTCHSELNKSLCSSRKCEPTL